MLRSIKHKLASKHGASLSMALMLMLVCATVAGVAITAASVVAGRQSQLKELDSSYYNVTSAASIFWEELKGLSSHPMEIVRECDAVQNGSGGLKPNHIKLLFDSNDGVPVNATLFQKISRDLVFGRAYNDLKESRVVSNEAFENSVDLATGETKVPAVTETPYDSFNVKVGTSEVKVTVTLRPDESVEFLFEEDTDPSTTCTLVASAGVVTDPVARSGDHYHWDTSVKWTPMYMSIGGAS